MYRVTLEGSGKHFVVDEGETVLAASRRAGLALPYSCLAGRCGSCRAHLRRGQVRYPYQPPLALDASELAQGDLLCCQAVPAGDLTIAIREVEAVVRYRSSETELVLAMRCVLTADIVRLRFEVPPAADWLPGQYLRFLLEDGRQRAFSIANRREDDPGHLEVHVRRVGGGSFTHTLCDQAPIGARFRVELPLGTCVPRPPSDRPLLLVAGGTGYGPIRALLAHFAAREPERELHLYRGARGRDELYLDDEAAARIAALPRGHYHRVLSEDPAPGCRYGLLHELVVADHPDLARHDVYMSGPPAMIDAARHALLARGLPEDRLYYDSFEYAPDVLAKLLHQQG